LQVSKILTCLYSFKILQKVTFGSSLAEARILFTLSIFGAKSEAIYQKRNAEKIVIKAELAVLYLRKEHVVRDQLAAEAAEKLEIWPDLLPFAPPIRGSTV